MEIEKEVNELGNKIREANKGLYHNPYYVASVEIVRREGVTNMMDKKGVVRALYNFELDGYAEYIENLTKEEYIELLNDLKEISDIE